ncbi:hypothetical protein ACP4OV_018571 [Aristida adscensionis]
MEEGEGSKKRSASSASSTLGKKKFKNRELLEKPKQFVNYF